MKVYRNSGNESVLEQILCSDEFILDVGCGGGDNARFLISRGHQVYGITFSVNEAKIAKKWCEKVYFHDIEKGLPAEITKKFDCCICSHVLEHICWPENVLRDIRCILTEGSGRLIVAIPNIMFFKTRLKLFLGKFEYTKTGIMDSTHFRWYTWDSMKKLLEKNGYTLLDRSASGSFPLGPVRRFLPNHFGKWIDGMAANAWPSLFGSQLVFVCSVKK
jgi:SAM-dependent methyltransferase